MIHSDLFVPRWLSDYFDTTKKEELPEIGIALSGGGVRAIAHLGVIQALEEHGLKPGIVSGVSGGAIVGALYADGYSPAEIVGLFQKYKFMQLARVAMPRKGLIASSRLYKTLGGLLRAQSFEELKMPLVINATDFSEGKPVYFSSGSLLKVIIASSSIPVLMNPVEMDGKQYVDGCIFCNLPARVIRDRCRTLIGVHVEPVAPLTEPLNSIIEIAERAYNLTIQSNTLEEKQACDVVIESVEAREFGLLDTSNSAQLFQVGYEAGIKAIEQYSEILKK